MILTANTSELPGGNQITCLTIVNDILNPAYFGSNYQAATHCCFNKGKPKAFGVTDISSIQFVQHTS